MAGTSGNGSFIGPSGDEGIGGLGNDPTILGSDGGGDDGSDGGGRDDGTFVYRDGHGCDLIKGFDVAEGIIAFDMAEISNFSDVQARMSEAESGTIITYDNGHTLRLEGIANSELSVANFQYSAGPVCFLAGMPICTERGNIPIEDLRPDDVIWTKDRGWQALKLVVLETIVFSHRDDPAKPVLIPQGALGDNMPTSDLIVSPQHRVLQILPDFGEEVLVPAVKLIGHNGIRRMRGKKRAKYMNVVLERHCVIQAAGCWVESLLVTRRSLSQQSAAARYLLDHALKVEPANRIEQKGIRPRELKLA